MGWYLYNFGCLEGCRRPTIASTATPVNLVANQGLYWFLSLLVPFPLGSEGVKRCRAAINVARRGVRANRRWGFPPLLPLPLGEGSPTLRLPPTLRFGETRRSPKGEVGRRDLAVAVVAMDFQRRRRAGVRDA